jgi:hypothetical protein
MIKQKKKKKKKKIGGLGILPYGGTALLQVSKVFFLLFGTGTRRRTLSALEKL